MTVAHAVAILPGEHGPARILDHTPVADSDALSRLARWAERFTPRVAVDVPSGLVLDATGCELLYGGLLPMARQVRLALTTLGLQTRVAVAPTIGLAWGLARFGDEGVCEPVDAIAALHELPTSALRIEPQVVNHLAEVGVDRVGQLAEIPRDEIARRFGEDVLLRLDQATGEAAELIDWQRHAIAPVSTFRFAGPTTQFEAIEQTVQILIADLCKQLHKLEAGARRIVWEIERLNADLHPEFTSQSLTLSAAMRDGKHLWAVLRPKVEQLHMGRGVEAMSLSAVDTASLPHGQLRSDGERDPQQDRQDIGRLVDRLQSKLGRENVLRCEPAGGYVPEAAYVFRPADEKPGKPLRQAVAERAEFDRPTRLLDPPEPAEVSLLNPEGPLITLRWASRSWHIITTVGPERIGRRWWRFTLSKQSLAARDYYKLQTDDGTWLWVFRTRSRKRTHEWFMHGLWI